MQPIEIPQSAMDYYQPQGGRVITFHAPPGHEDDTGPAGGLVIGGLDGQTYGRQVSLPLELDDAERAAIAEGKPIWLTLAGQSVIPFVVSVGDIPPVI